MEDSVRWRGSLAHKGHAASVVGQGWTGHALPLPEDTPLSVLPAQVTGPLAFTVVGVWTQPEPSDVEHLLRGIDALRPHLPEGPLVVMGDFNSNTRWDRPGTPQKNHARLVQTLAEEFGLHSAYHYVHGVEHGQERHPTHYFQFREDQPFHIDYVFVPREWADRLTRVDVGTFEDWPTSDHRPLLVELDLP